MILFLMYSFFKRIFKSFQQCNKQHNNKDFSQRSVLMVFFSCFVYEQQSESPKDGLQDERWILTDPICVQGC